MIRVVVYMAMLFLLLLTNIHISLSKKALVTPLEEPIRSRFQVRGTYSADISCMQARLKE